MPTSRLELRVDLPGPAALHAASSVTSGEAQSGPRNQPKCGVPCMSAGKSVHLSGLLTVLTCHCASTEDEVQQLSRLHGTIG